MPPLNNPFNLPLQGKKAMENALLSIFFTGSMKNYNRLNVLYHRLKVKRPLKSQQTVNCRSDLRLHGTLHSSFHCFSLCSNFPLLCLHPGVEKLVFYFTDSARYVSVLHFIPPRLHDGLMQFLNHPLGVSVDLVLVNVTVWNFFFIFFKGSSSPHGRLHVIVNQKCLTDPVLTKSLFTATDTSPPQPSRPEPSDAPKLHPTSSAPQNPQRRQAAMPRREGEGAGRSQRQAAPAAFEAPPLPVPEVHLSRRPPAEVSS